MTDKRTPKEKEQEQRRKLGPRKKAAPIGAPPIIAEPRRAQQNTVYRPGQRRPIA